MRLARSLLGLALLLQAGCGGLRPGELPPGAMVSPVFPIAYEAALDISHAALAAEIRPHLIETVSHPFPGHRGWLRFVVGLDSLALFVVAQEGLDADGTVRPGYAFAAYYDGNYDPGGQALAHVVLQHAVDAARAFAEPLAPLPEPQARPR